VSGSDEWKRASLVVEWRVEGGMEDQPNSHSCILHLARRSFTTLNLTKLDVLTGMPELKIGTHYMYKGKHYDTMPANLKVMGGVEVKYETLPGWKEDISKITKFEDLPLNARRYVLRVQELLGVPIRWIGVGPNRDDVVDRGEKWELKR